MDNIPVQLAAVTGPLVKAAEAPDAIQTQAAVASTQREILGALRETAELLVQIEGAAEYLAEQAKRIRSGLLEAMIESGCPGLDLQHHTVGYATGAPSAVITGDIPPEFMRVPEPAPDRTAIAKALRGGRAVPGAVLKNPMPHLTVRARKS